MPFAAGVVDKRAQFLSVETALRSQDFQMKRFLAASAVLLAIAACQPKAEPVDVPVVEAPLIPAPEAPVLAAPVGDIDPETAALAGVWLLTAVSEIGRAHV